MCKWRKAAMSVAPRGGTGRITLGNSISHHLPRILGIFKTTIMDTGMRDTGDRDNDTGYWVGFTALVTP
jgi:hypothetical protein